MEGSKAGRGIEVGDNIVISPSKDAAKAAAAKVVKLRLPTLFSRWAGREGEVDKIKRFFQRQDGVVAVSEGRSLLAARPAGRLFRKCSACSV